MAGEQGYRDFMQTCLGIQSTTELNQKLTNSKAFQKTIWAIYTREKYLSKKLRVKEKGEYLLEGPYLWELTVYVIGKELCVTYEQSNRTPRCSQEVSAAGLPWLKHFEFSAIHE